MNFLQAELYLKEKLLCKTEKYLLCYHSGFIVLRCSADKKLIHKRRINSHLSSIRLVERALRYEPRAAAQIDDDKFIFSMHGCIYRYNAEDNSIFAEHTFVHGMNNPLDFCVRRDEFGNITDLLYGEYINNSDKKPISIYRRKNDMWVRIYSFSAGTVQHIHNITYDRYKNCYLIMTGDSDAESGIWEADTDFTKVRPIALGRQIYRCCVCFPTKDGIYYPTDTPLESNKLYRLNEKDDGTINLTEICEMPGPCIFGTVINDCLYMATSVEGDPTLGNFRYKFSDKLGKGVKDRLVHIIKYKPNGSASEIASFKKDFLPMWLFQFGNVQFPEQCSNNMLLICPQAVKGEKGTFAINI